MTIPWFLGIACVFMALIAFVSYVNSRAHKIKEEHKHIWVWFMIPVFILGILSPFVLRHYIFPKDGNVFDNAQYHVLEHTGFNVSSPFYLVNDKDIPETAIYDSKEGTVMLNRENGGEITLEASEFYEPLYVTDPENTNQIVRWIKKNILKKEKKAHLINRYIKSNLSKGFSISSDGRLIYSMEIVPFDKDKCYYISSISGCDRKDTSDFTKEISEGYMLSEIVYNTPGLEITEELRVILDGTMLVRETIGEKGSDLVLMPNQWLGLNTGIEVNGESVDNDLVFKETLQNGALIHTGFGFRMTPKMKVTTLDSTSISLRYLMPVRKKLRDCDSKLLITSSIDVASENTEDGIFLFNVFDKENNLNHINGTLHYGVGDSRTDMIFHVHDLKAFSDNSSENTIGSDTEFGLQTSGSNEPKPCEWTFNIHNMRETNGLTYSRILWLFVGLFLLLVCVRVFTDQWLNSKKRYKSSLSGFEMGTYIVLLAFGVTRLIIAWRVSTFTPTDNIGINAYSEMRRNVLLITLLSCHFVPLLMTFWSVFSTKKKWLNRIKFPNVKNHLYIIVGYSLVVTLLWFLRNTPFVISERFAVILFPLLIYFYVDFWFIQLLRTKKIDKNASWVSSKIKSIGWERPLVFLIATLSFFVGDAGFAVIFIVFTMVRSAVTILTEDTDVLSRFWRITGFIVILLATFIFIIIEGFLMIYTINHLSIILPVSIAVFFGVILYVILKNELKHRKLAAISVIAIGVLTIIFSVTSPIMRDMVSKRGVHMKYRAAVQELKKNQDISVLMTDCKFNSRDIVFIMRSAQNQWFINQYLKAGKNLDGYFRIQTHSNQGSPYNTQTTDLVVTRYLKAEHKGPVAELMIIMLLLLIATYCNEVDVTGRSDGKSRGFLSMLVFLFVIAFSVYMSATNRSVFMGQDFPFLSIQSKLAVILPVILMVLATQHVMLIMGNREADFFYGKSNTLYTRGANDDVTPLIIFVSLFVFTLVGWKLVPSKGVEQQDRQFDVNRIINEVSQSVERIDDAFIVFQEQNEREFKGKEFDEIWRSFIAESNEWKTIADTTRKGSIFIPSLMNEFSQCSDDEKFNPEELVHVRKRGNIYRLCVNKRFYFIERIIDSNNPWTGNLLAAETPLYFKFSNTNNPRVGTVRINNDDDYETNILPSAQRSMMSNVQIMRFDQTWTADQKPLLLIKTIPNNEQYFDIESRDFIARGSDVRVQMATRILENDIITVNRKTGHSSTNVLTWRYGQDNQRFLAKNIWINGRQTLFYPLGKESMWSYQFANLVSNVYGDASLTDTSFRHRNLQVSIDYDLHKDFYSIIDKMNSGSVNMSDEVRDNLAELINEPYIVKTSGTYYLYFDKRERKFKPGKNIPARNVREVGRLVNFANGKLKRYGSAHNVDSVMVNEVIEDLIKRKFSYSAVVLDGYGRIRLLFDYNKRGQRIDPNNTGHYNKFLSDMYRNGSNDIERDVLGNKNLQHLNPGPGSTFKPIVYTAITATKKLDWETIDVIASFRPDGVIHKKEANDDNTNARYDWYGGVQAKQGGMGYFPIDGKSGYEHNNYIIKSNNFYHSVIVLLGMQRGDHVKKIIGPARPGAEGFPQFKYGAEIHSFNPEEWFVGNENSINLGNSIMEEGLRDNFRLNIDYNTDKYEKYFNPFGTDRLFGVLYSQQRYSRQWCYPEAGSLNRYLRQRMPWLRWGFVQMVSGSAPLSVSPLQVASMGMRLSTLNSSDNITTLNDTVRHAPEIVEFDVTTGGWTDNEEYFNFYKTQVLGQMKKVPYHGGTASALEQLAKNLAKRGYYLYVKTGTLNIDDNKSKRIRNMMVIIANGELEKAQTLADLRKIRYYVIYMSYNGVDKVDFNNGYFRSQIEAVVNSELFNQYMREGR